ncbi:MAG: DUF5110 domain-containing protein, partial [Bacteroidales bacterium]|nr:DUF5110 domain-containing protein [Bacteroidales bacterium]
QGSIIPMGEVIQHTAQPQHELSLLVYPGADAEFSLYEDDGLHYNYEKGEFANVRFTYDEESSTLRISAREGAYAQASDYHIKVYLMREGSGIDALDEPCCDLYYQGQALEVALSE